MSDAIFNNAVCWRYENEKIALFDNTGVKLGIVESNDQNWAKLSDLKEMIDYEFALKENGKIYIVFGDGGLQIFPVLSVDFDHNCLVSKHEYTRVWFPPSAQIRYLRMLKCKTIFENNEQ
jgi:hypothetical protein